MMGGTYKKALEVGFTEQQATFMAHLSMDTKQEAIDAFEEIITSVEDEMEYEDENKMTLKTHGILAFLIIGSFCLGRLF